jgi:hypothetical protein
MRAFFSFFTFAGIVLAQVRPGSSTNNPCSDQRSRGLTGARFLAKPKSSTDRSRPAMVEFLNGHQISTMKGNHRNPPDSEGLKSGDGVHKRSRDMGRFEKTEQWKMHA